MGEDGKVAAGESPSWPCYQYDADDKLVTFRDFAAVHGITPWTRHTFVFETEPPASVSTCRWVSTTRGTMWIDDLRLSDVTGLAYHPMNTATGSPARRTDTAPLALGMFDADYPLKREPERTRRRGRPSSRPTSASSLP